MPNFQVPNLEYLRAKVDPKLGEALTAIQLALNNVGQQSATSPQSQHQPPTQPASLNVTAAGGIFDVAIQDNAPNSTGLAVEYFLEYSTTAGFNAPVQIHLGPARNWRGMLGNQTLYWRCYSQLGRASNASTLTYFGPANAPTPVAGGGVISGPVPLASAGSGTTPTNGRTGGVGYGILPQRSQG